MYFTNHHILIFNYSTTEDKCSRTHHKKNCKKFAFICTRGAYFLRQWLVYSWTIHCLSFGPSGDHNEQSIHMKAFEEIVLVRNHPYEKYSFDCFRPSLLFYTAFTQWLVVNANFTLQKYWCSINWFTTKISITYRKLQLKDQQEYYFRSILCCPLCTVKMYLLSG